MGVLTIVVSSFFPKMKEVKGEHWSSLSGIDVSVEAFHNWDYWTFRQVWYSLQ